MRLRQKHHAHDTSGRAVGADSRPDPTASERLLAFVSADHPDSFRGLSNLIAMLAFHVGCRHVHLGFFLANPAFLVSGVLSLFVAIGVLIESRHDRIRYSPLLLLGSVILFVPQKLSLGNHGAMECLILLSLVIALPISAKRAPVVAGFLRWTAIVLFLGSGLQKIFYGAYFNGSFLARRIGIERFSWVLDLALPRAEFDRLLRADRLDPMVFESVSGLLLSNSVYLAEIGCAALLLIPRTRSLGFFVAVATVVGIETVAREVGFGLMFILILLLFRPQWLESRRILTFPVLAHLALGIVHLRDPGFLAW